MIAKAAKLFVFAALLPLSITVTWLWISQESMIFPAPDLSRLPDEIEGFAKVSIETSDGETLVGYWKPPQNAKASILVFHGNGDAAIRQQTKGYALSEAGFGVLLAEYRGYGGSTGKPSEAGLHLDTLAAYDFVRSRTDGLIGVYAHSLGTGVAIKLASEREVFALVLESPFDSILALAQSNFPWLPVRALLRHPFLSENLIGDIRAPVLMMHGTADRVIPIEHGRRLAERARQGTQFIEIEGAGHNDLLRFGTLEKAVEFFRNAVR